MSLASAQTSCDARQIFQSTGGSSIKARVPVAYEWWLAALGTTDTNFCNTTSSVIGVVTSTPTCVSKSGAQNMIGNVEEWVSDTASGLPTGYIVGVDSQGTPKATQSSASSLTALYSDDYVLGGSGPMARGGQTGDGTGAGIYAVRVNPASNPGFRCVVK